MKVTLAAALAASAALAAPAAAGAATIATPGACYATGTAVPVAGSGFTAASFVTLGGEAFGSGRADAAGNLAAQVSAPFVSTIAPKVVTVTASDSAGNAGTTRFRVIRDLMVSNAPLSGRPRQRTTWRFAGFLPGRPIYGHFRFRGKTWRNYRFGRAAGPCGTLVVRARRAPVRTLRSGTWTLQLDQRRTYKRSGPRRVIRFRIFRTLL
jgi:hypothetical protein